MSQQGSIGGGGVIGANRNLSNLLPTAINESLIPDTDSTLNLGSSVLRWDDVFLNRINLNNAPGTDLTANGIITNDLVGEPVSFGQPLYLDTDGKYYRADADTGSRMPAVVLALETCAADTLCDLLHMGYARDDSWSWTRGDTLYVSETIGDINNVVPADTGDYSQIIGYAVDTNIIFFNPDGMLFQIGDNDDVLTADDSNALGYSWQPPSGGGGGFPEKYNWQAGQLEALESDFAPLEVVDFGTVIQTLAAYDDTTEEFRNGSFQCPADLDAAGTVTFRAYVVPKTAAASSNVRLRIGHRSLASAEGIDGAYIEENSADVLTSAIQDVISVVEWTETVANLGWTAEELVIFRLSRISALGTGLVGDLYLINFIIEVPQA